MFSDIFNWRTALAALAILIVSGTIFYSGYVSRKIQGDERKKIELWADAQNTFMKTDDKYAIDLVASITTKNTTIPIILTNENDSIIDHLNLDTTKALRDSSYVKRKLKSFKSLHQPVSWANPLDSTQKNLLYYGKSTLSNEVKLYPLIQLLVVAMFIIVTLILLQTSNRSTQNQVWAGMAKETAHQLGTPVSSLKGWLEMLKESNTSTEITTEIEKDIMRLELISDRFGKIGSTPKFIDTNIVERIELMMDYMKKRASGKVVFGIHAGQYDDTNAPISPQLFDWVIENLYKNALDALEGKGSIHTYIYRYDDKVIIDVSDTGKGIPRNKWKTIFKPGFTTKKRGWGLGLSLTRRIVQAYHQGKIYVKESEPGKGTTIRVILPKKREE
jgi:signal transduction histidine kinase